MDKTQGEKDQPKKFIKWHNILGAPSDATNDEHAK